MKVGTDGVLLGAWAACAKAQRVLDVGTGSGLIALMLAQRTHDSCQIDGIDIDGGAYEQASANFAASPWATRLHATQADLLAWPDDARYDLIVSNPPYFPHGPDIACEQRRLARYSDTLDGLRVIESGQPRLTEQGSIALVLPYEYALGLLEAGTLAEMHLWRRCDVVTKRGQPPHRMLLQLAQQPQPVEHTQLTLHAEQGYSEQFIALTREFYLRM